MAREKMLDEIKGIRQLSYEQFKTKKRKNESDSDYIKRVSGNRCAYCRRQFSSDKLSIVRKNPEKQMSKIKNGICACKNCANEKGGMSDYEYKRFRDQKKRETRKAILEIYPQLRDSVFSKYGHTCIYCVYEHGRGIEGRKLTIDHKIPLSKGGSNDLRNLCCACEEHNFDKRDMTAEEYFKKLERRKKSEARIAPGAKPAAKMAERAAETKAIGAEHT